MADAADQAQSLVEKHLQRSLDNIPSNHIPFSGYCLSCEEEVSNARFCGPDCRDEYEHRVLMRNRGNPKHNH